MYENITDAVLALNNSDIIKKIADAARTNTGETISLGFPRHVDQKDKIHFMLNSAANVPSPRLSALTIAIEEILGYGDISDERETVIVHLKISNDQLKNIFSSVVLFTVEKMEEIHQFLRTNYKEIFDNLPKINKAAETEIPTHLEGEDVSQGQEFDPDSVVQYLQKDPKVWNSLKRSPVNCSIVFEQVKKALLEENASKQLTPSTGVKQH